MRFITPDSVEQAVLQLQATKPSSGLQLLNQQAASAAGGSKGSKRSRASPGNKGALAEEVEYQDMLKVVKTLNRRAMQ